MKLIVLSGILLFPSLAGAGEFFLVENGQPRAEIVVAEKPARMARFAAQELQAYVRKISGATLPIVAAPSPGAATRIDVGESAFTRELGLSTAGLENGAFRMASGSDWLALLGPDEDFVPIEPWGRSRSREETARVNAAWDKITGDTFWNNFREVYSRYHPDLDVWDYDDAGTLNAVYEFLRGLGVRWYAPGEIGEVVPTLATIPLPEINRTIRPDFALRRLSHYSEQHGLGEVGLWNLRLGLNQGHKLIGMTQPGHGIKFVIMREEMKRAHPEFYAIWGGKRETTHKGTGAPCLSSPGLFDKHLKYARAVFDHFQQPMISIDMVDGYGATICECDSCRVQATPQRGWQGGMSDYVWGYINRLALELHKSHPDRMVSGLSYSAYQLPPEKIARMSPNLAIIECRWRSTFHDEETRSRHRAAREAWLKKLPSGKYFIWDYYLHSRPEEAGRPVFFPRLIAQDLRELQGVSLGDTIEVYRHPPNPGPQLAYDPLAIDHLNLYVTSRLWWDAGQDLDALLDDYYANYYGPARGPMKAFIEYSESNWRDMRREADKISAAFRLLEEAQAAVDPNSAFAQRIQRIADFMKPLKNLQQQLARKRETTESYRVLLTSQAGGRSMAGKPLDGQLDKEFWPPVRVAQLTRLGPKTSPRIHTTFQVLREGQVLYFGIRCAEPDMKNVMIASSTPGDPAILKGDFVTLLVETSSHSYYEIAVNPAGVLLEIDHGEGGSPRWTSGAQAAVHRGEGFWSAEIRLPIAGEGAKVLDPSRGMDGAGPKQLYPWYFNVVRQRVRGEQAERYAFSATASEDFHVPERFAEMWGK